MSPLVTPEDVSVLLGRELTPTERTRALIDIETCISQLESWARRKFESVTIYNERHIVSGEPGALFLRWGEPTGNVLVRYGSVSAQPLTYTADTWGNAIHSGLNSYYGHGNLNAYITYVVDTTLVDQFASSIKQVVMNSVIKSLLLPDVIRFGAITSYSVEGLSVHYGSEMGADEGRTIGEREQGSGRFSNSDLAPLAPLKRRMVL